MRVNTSFFIAIESLRPDLDRSADGAPSDSTPAAGKDAMNARREWLGMHEGENRIALFGEPIPGSRPTHGKARLKVQFSTIFVE